MGADPPQPNPAPLQGVLLLLLAALVGLALATHGSPRPACGPIADAFADRVIGGLGPILSWGLWASIPPTAVLWALGRRKRVVLLMALLLLPLGVVATITAAGVGANGGAIGTAGFDGLEEILGPWGRWIALLAIGIVSIWLAWRFVVPAAIREALGSVRLPERARRDDPPPRRPRVKSAASPPRLALVDPSRSTEAADAEDGIGKPEPSEPRIRMRAAAKPAPATIRPATAGQWTLPDVSLLQDLEGTRSAIDREEILETSKLLVKTLLDFDVQGRVGEVHPGPVITRYEFEPSPGVRVSQIVSRIDDLALALRASRIRLVAPIPGKAAVGIEVPNRRPALISLKEILDAEEFRHADGPLVLGLGRDIAGIPVFARLDAMPHLLVAGTTGSGKSVCLNTLILSLLFRRTPDELRLLLIDPKRLELTPYDGIPSLLCPVVTEPKHAVRMLEWLCGEMDRRYRILHQAAVRNIDSYRTRIAMQGKARKGSETGEPEPEALPYIAVVVDELADLMLTQGADIEGPISRLAHMARAVGIHMILATQRPSVDVLTGVIKANFPARIAFQVASRIDSRTILDAGGAEFLLGRGDMLYVPPGKAEAVRVHGAFCTDTDAERVAAFLREQPPAPAIVPEETEGGAPGDPAHEDELFSEALRVIVRERQASVSFLQRRLKVGYARAARLMDLLEAAGVVSPYDGSKARLVQVDEKYLEEWDERQGEAGGRRP
jgi:DNA segregation ATPase FtsK/SpoIIIE, S-DNA-T family